MVANQATETVTLDYVPGVTTADELELPLATLNVKHFPMFAGLKPAY